jgi:chaperonin GroES
MVIEPLADRLVVAPVAEDDVSAGGVFLPESVREKPRRGHVVAVGHGWATEDGRRIPLTVAVGDEVVFARHAGTEISDDGCDYLILREADVFAVVV